MNNSIENAFKKLSEMLKGDTPKQVNEILNSLGISKEELQNTLNETNQDDLLNKIKKDDVDKVLKNLTPKELQNLKNMKIGNDQLGELYKNFLKSKQGN